VVHSSKLPGKTTREQAVAMLNDHEFFLHCDPHMAKFEPVPHTDDTSASLPLPDTVKARPGTATESFRVTDIVDSIPSGVWGRNVVSTYEFTDTETGLFVRIKSPLAIVMDTIWEIKQVEDGEGLELVEDVTINCSRLLVGLVKSQCENGWAKIHAKMIGRLEEGISKTSQ
jgi:hypothetical protein